MSGFTGMFNQEISDRRSSVKQALEGGVDGEIGEAVSGKIESVFNTQEVDETEGFRVMGTDAGRNEIEFRNNTNFFVARASTTDSGAETSRALETGVVRPYRKEDYEEFMRRISEKVEIESMLKAIENEDFEEPTYLLVDGTLLTRMYVKPGELRISDRKNIKARLTSSFQKLLEQVRSNEKLVLVGVSKDPNSGILYRKIMKEILEDRLEEVSGETDLADEDLENLYEEFESIGYAPSKVERAIDNLETGDELRKIRELFERFRVRHSDREILQQFTDTEGFTDPVSLSVSIDSREVDQDDHSHLRALRKLPNLRTLYWRPKNDSPIRLDFLGEGKLLDDREPEVKNLSETEAEVLKLIKTGYAGENMHNVWISQADEDAGLSNQEMKNVYRPLLESQLGENLDRYARRRDKRA